MNVPSTPPASPPATRAQTFAFGVLALGFVLLGLFTLKTFLDALVWAGIFAIALWPLYERAIARFPPGRHNILMPAMFTLGVAFLFILPLGIVGVQLAGQADRAQDWLQDVRSNGIAEPATLEHLPFGQSQLDNWWQQNLGTPANARKLVQQATHGHVAHVGQLVGEQVIHRLTDFVFTLLTLFFLFKEGHRLTRQTQRVATRAFGLGGERVGRQIIASVHGTVNGLVLVGLGEGVLLGIVYAVAGVPEATVFGLLTAGCRHGALRGHRRLLHRGPGAARAGFSRLGDRGLRHGRDRHLRGGPFHPSGAHRGCHAAAVPLGVAGHPRRCRGLGPDRPVHRPCDHGGAHPVVAGMGRRGAGVTSSSPHQSSGGGVIRKRSALCQTICRACVCAT